MSGAPEGHRADLDGLRGLAVVLVVLFHAWPGLVPGGFVGVDVFFVISGFVVGRMVQRQLATGRFSAADFFVRRVNRLAPALLATVVGTLGVLVFWASPPLLERSVLAAAAGLAMVANLLAGAQSSYFDPATELKPLLHLWSLGVEEQFYLSVPLAVWLVRRVGRANERPLGDRPLDSNGDEPRTTVNAAPEAARRGRRLFSASGLGALALLSSFAACLALGTRSLTWAYFLPFTRGWELLAGVLLAHGWERLAPTRARFSDAFGLAGVVSVVGGAFLLGRGQLFPSEWTLLPVVGTGWCIASGPSSFLARQLSRAPFVWLGLLSYSLYLWHWPVLTLMRLATPHAQHVVAVPLGVALSVLLAWLTTHFLERPVRARQSPRIAKALALGAAGLTLGLLVVVVALQPEQWAWRKPAWAKLTRFVKTYDCEKDARLGTCLLTEEKLIDAPSCTEASPAEAPLVFVWGDSFAARLTAGLRHFQGEPARFRVAQRTRASCPPLLEAGSGWCPHGNAVVLDELKSLAPEVLVLHGMWSSPSFKPTELDQTLTILGRALPKKTKVMLVGQPPLWGPGLPWALTRRVSGEAIPERLMPETIALQREQDAILRGLAAKHGVPYVSALEALCTPDDTCLVRLADEPLMLTSWDVGHLTTPAAEIVAQHLAVAW